MILILYLTGLLFTSWVALGTWIPPTSGRGIWFYSALAALLLGSLLISPFFTKPADAIAYAVAALIALLSVNTWARAESSGFDHFTWSAAMLYVVAVLIAAVAAIAGKDSPRPFVKKAAQSASVWADLAGSPRAVFSAVFFFALTTYHRAEAREYLIISIAWAVFVGMRPLESLAMLWQRWRRVWFDAEKLSLLGEVVSHKTPGILLIREASEAHAKFGDLLIARTERGQSGIAVALDHVGFASGRWLRAIHLKPSTGAADTLHSSAAARTVLEGSVLQVSPPATEAYAAAAGDTRERLIGLVAPETDVGRLRFELVRPDIDLREGSLVEVEIRGKPVLYQVMGGLTREAILQERNTRGFVRAEAKKIGLWNSAGGAFDPVAWLPQPNQPVFLVSPEELPVTRRAIGHFPATSYPVCIDPHLLVTHNTAILGILGVGKSFLAIELVERIIDAGIRVVCLDLTDQYATELAPFLDIGAEDEAHEELMEIGPVGKANAKKNVEEGGSISEFTNKIKEQLEAFVDPANDHKLRVLNPAQYEVWRQDSKPYEGQASMATLTPTEITRIITETLLEVLQEQGLSEPARCCIVYEEAHSLIPEWSAVASEGDKAATNGTAKAILQGRKFGLGCLVITQRTANVTKSILNQCNTIFALRVFDATGMEFLKNYIGLDYAGVLSTLEDRHAVVFGRASSCRDPVLTRLNDRADFLRAFREPNREGQGEGEEA